MHGVDVEAVDGTTAQVKVPRELKAGKPIKDEGERQALPQYATALRSFLGPDGKLTLQGDGAKFRAIPGFSETMTEQRITGIGVLQRVLEFVPQFVVEGKSPKSSAKLT